MSDLREITKEEYEQFIDENNASVGFTLRMGLGNKGMWCAFSPTFVRKDLMNKIVSAVKNVIDEDMATCKEGEKIPFYDEAAYLEYISKQQSQDPGEVS